MREEFRCVERGTISDCILSRRKSAISWFWYSSFVRTSTTNWQRSGTTLCCVPALICVTVIFTGPSSGDTLGN